MRNLILLLAAFVLLNSCKKFKHQDLALPACSLCAFADSLNGTYRGFADGMATPENNQTGWGDSVTMTVEHIYMHTSQYEDSTVMHFRTSFKYDSEIKTIYDTIQIKGPYGVVLNEAYRTYAYIPKDENYYASENYYVIDPQQIRIHVIGPTGMSSGILYLHGVFERE